MTTRTGHNNNLSCFSGTGYYHFGHKSPKVWKKFFFSMNCRKTPYLVPGNTIVLKKKFFKLVPGIKYKSFQNFFTSKNGYLDRYKYSKNTFFEFFSCEKVMLLGFSTGKKFKKRFFWVFIPLIFNFFRAENFFKFFLAAVSARYYHPN